MTAALPSIDDPLGVVCFGFPLRAPCIHHTRMPREGQKKWNIELKVFVLSAVFGSNFIRNVLKRAINRSLQQKLLRSSIFCYLGVLQLALTAFCCSEEKLFFLHIPKSGGLSATFALQDHYAINESAWLDWRIHGRWNVFRVVLGRVS